MKQKKKKIIVNSFNEVIQGNARLQALKKHGIKELPKKALKYKLS